MKLFAAFATFTMALAVTAFSEPRATSFSESVGQNYSSPIARTRLERSYVSAYALPLRWSMPDLNAGGIAANLTIGEDLATYSNFEGTFSDIFGDYSARAGALWDGGGGLRLAFEAESETSQVKEFGSETIVWANFAAAIELTESIEITGLISNLNGAYFSGGGRTKRRTAAVGVLYSLYEELTLEAETAIEIDAATLGRVGAKWRAVDFLAFRALYSTDGGMRFGSELAPSDNIIIELNFERRPRLGLGSGVLISYAWR